MNARTRNLLHRCWRLSCLRRRHGHAEPYFAVREGLKCVELPCQYERRRHAQRVRHRVGSDRACRSAASRFPGVEMWTGAINRYVAIGGNLRAGYTYTDVPRRATRSPSSTSRKCARISPSSVDSRSRDAVRRPAPRARRQHESRSVCALHISESALVRQSRARCICLTAGGSKTTLRSCGRSPAINFATPDEGRRSRLGERAMVSAARGYERHAGGPENGRGQAGQPAGRARPFGAGASARASTTTTRTRAIGRCRACSPGCAPARSRGSPKRTTSSTIVSPMAGATSGSGCSKATGRSAAGQNLKLTAEYFDPDDDVDEDEQNRFSVVWEYVPFSSCSCAPAHASTTASRRTICRIARPISSV